MTHAQAVAKALIRVQLAERHLVPRRRANHRVHFDRRWVVLHWRLLMARYEGHL